MWPRLFWPAVALLMVTVAALVFRHALLLGVRRWTGQRADDSRFLQAIRVPSMLWCLVFGLFVALEMADLPPRLAAQIHVVLEAAIILSVTMTVAGVLGSLVETASARRALAVGVTGLFRTSVYMVVLIVGGLVLLSSLGIAITPILTALGVGGLAVALALQDTLSNLFAGVHLLADKPIRVGDYVKLSAENVEGYVVDVGWRSTRIRMLQNNVVVVPNKRVAESIITNYDLGEKRMALPIRVRVGYEADADRVERVLEDEAARAVGQVAGLLADPAPSARLIPGFGDYALEFTLACHVATFVDQFLVQHELRKRLLKRLRAEGITMPLPTTVTVTRS
ncbi:MAG TPA: mechanosensitive ion channel family protein [Methylomirabilota bacterium]|jgi:small-conductance mechanosensitive channel|nr:mechanosensitive ion channel family protein [Methylomirabilota bacterium]